MAKNSLRRHPGGCIPLLLAKPLPIIAARVLIIACYQVG